MTTSPRRRRRSAGIQSATAPIKRRSGRSGVDEAPPVSIRESLPRDSSSPKRSAASADTASAYSSAPDAPSSNPESRTSASLVGNEASLGPERSPTPPSRAQPSSPSSRFRLSRQRVRIIQLTLFSSVIGLFVSTHGGSVSDPSAEVLRLLVHPRIGRPGWSCGCPWPVRVKRCGSRNQLVDRDGPFAT